MAQMTRYDYHMTMKTVRIADLKARLSEHLRGVRKGHELTVYDRDEPIARIVPWARRGALSVREPVRAYESLRDVPLPPPVRLDVDAVDLLLEDRESGR
jgi:prevent-host-death family protein